VPLAVAALERLDPKAQTGLDRAPALLRGGALDEPDDVPRQRIDDEQHWRGRIVFPPPVGRQNPNRRAPTGKKWGRLHRANAAEPQVAEVFSARQALVTLDIGDDDALAATQRPAAAAARAGVHPIPEGGRLRHETFGGNQPQLRSFLTAGLDACAVCRDKLRRDVNDPAVERPQVALLDEHSNSLERCR